MAAFDFGYVDDLDQSLVSDGVMGGRFGLNESARLTKFEYNPSAGGDGDAGEAVDIEMEVGGRAYRRRVFNPSRAFDRHGNVITDTESPEYVRRIAGDLRQAMGLVHHVAKAVGVTDARLRKALETPPADFADWASTVVALLPQDFASRSLHVFLEYQWSIAEGRDRTWPEIPKNMKGGLFCVPAVPAVGSWREERSWSETVNGRAVPVRGLRYVDDGGNVHPFTRRQAYMESNKANMQGDARAVAAPASAVAAGLAPAW